MNQSAKEYFAEKSYRESCYVVRGKNTSLYLNVHDSLSANIECARAFTYEEAQKHLRVENFKTWVFEIVKYAPKKDDTDLESEDETESEEMRKDRKEQFDYDSYRERNL